MVKSFVTLANLTADDDIRSDAILEWIEAQCEQIPKMKSSCGSNILSLYITHIASKCGASYDIGSDSLHDPKYLKRKDSPKKFRKKCPLESSLNKVKVCSNLNFTSDPPACAIQFSSYIF